MTCSRPASRFLTTVGGPAFAPGQWTDDTSMALCLAESLVERSGFDARDQMERYVRWWQHGHLSSTGRCFDIGTTTRAALQRYLQSGDPFAGSTDPQSAGNGSLMRLAPIAMYYRNQPEQCIAMAADSSRTTHGAPTAVDACRYFAGLLLGALLKLDQVACIHARLQLLQQVAPVLALQQRALGLAIGVAEMHPHQEAVELRFRKRKRANLVGRILCRDHEKWLRQVASLAFRGDLVFFHGLEERALGLRGRSIDLVSQDHLVEDRPGMELESAILAVEYRDADDVGRQQIAGELDALKSESERCRKRMRQHRLADARHVLDQQMAPCQEARDGEPDLPLLAQDDIADLGNDAFELLRYISRAVGAGQIRRIPWLSSRVWHD